MRKIILLALLVCCYGCAPNLQVQGLPEWIDNPPNDDVQYLYASRSGASRDMSMATTEAELLARTQLAQQMEGKLENLEKRFSEQFKDDTGGSEVRSQLTSVIKTVTVQTLRNCRVEKRKTQQLKNGNFRVYVLMSLPIGEANAAMMAEIKDNEHLYTRFRASEAFKELEKEVEAYEKARKGQ